MAQRAYKHTYEYSAPAPRQSVKKKANPRAKVHRQVFLWTLVLTAAALFLLSRHAELDNTRRELRNITAELNTIENTNQHLQRQIDRSINLPELRMRAIEEFGMREIEPHQVFDIDMNITGNVGEIISRRLDTVPIEQGILYGIPGVLIRTIETLR